MRERATAKSDSGNDALRITAQFRTREGMAYELRERGTRLTVLITASNTDDTGGPWRVEAFASTAPSSTVVHAAETRREALRRTGEQWATEAVDRSLPTFDWTAVAQALTLVRAI